MLAVRAMLVVVTVIAVGAYPPFVPRSGPSDAGATTLSAAVAARSPLADNDNNDYRTELEGQVFPVQCPTVRGSEPRFEAVCADVPEGTFIPAINKDSTPPSMLVHNLDGAVWVTFYNPAKLDEFQEGDYVRIDGRRVRTFLFRGDEGSTEDNDNS